MKKIVVIETYGLLTELRGIVGPCLYPQPIDEIIIKRLIDGGKIVKECDPADPSNVDTRIRLTQRNFNTQNFGEVVEVVEETKVEEEAEPVVEETKVEEEAEPVVEETTVEEVKSDVIEVKETVSTDDFKSGKKRR